MEYRTEIGAVIVKNGEVVEEFDTFVKPGKPIKKLTGDNILDQFMDEIYKL